MAENYRRAEAIRSREIWQELARVTGTGADTVAAGMRFAEKAREMLAAKPADLTPGDVAALARLRYSGLEKEYYKYSRISL